MHLIHLTPGTGSFHCGSCLRDGALIKALRVRGHDAMMVPLYLPLVTDRDDPSSTSAEIQVGGISLYLQQKLPWFHLLPRFILRWLNDPARLRKASLRMGMTSAKVLGEMTVGSLVGTRGRQWAEWKKLIAWLKEQPKIDVISLSNSLLTGLAGAIKEETGARVVCSLQGEDAFLDTLAEPYREQAWEALRANVQHLDRIIAPSQFYADGMAARLHAAPGQMAVVPNGIDSTPFPVAEPDANWPTIAFFARMIHGKGLTTLVDAFITLARSNRVPRLKLKVGGAQTAADEPYLEGLKEKLKEAGLLARAEFHPNLSFDEKMRFFRDVSVLSVPATYGEAFGLYVIEALACGIPVVQPASGAFPEIIEATGGGLLCQPDDVDSLASTLERLLLDHQLREQLSLKGMTTVRTHFTATAMAARFEEAIRP